jgi:ATP-binding cassette, subfamily B (MDR/TAP), member 1
MFAASSVAAGTMLQSLTTISTCLVLALLRSPSLAAVLSQTLTAPLLAAERQQTAVAATLVDRAVGAVATVKAFNAQASKLVAVSTALSRANNKARKLVSIWGACDGDSQFVMMAMFVSGTVRSWSGTANCPRESRSGSDTKAST